MRMDDLGVFAEPNKNAPFRNSLTRGTSIAADVYSRRWEIPDRSSRGSCRRSHIHDKRIGGQQNHGSQQMSRRLSIANNVLRFALNLREAAKIRIYFAN
jgi:hypothetical protein